MRGGMRVGGNGRVQGWGWEGRGGCRDEGGREGESAGMRVGGKGRVQG